MLGRTVWVASALSLIAAAPVWSQPPAPAAAAPAFDVAVVTEEGMLVPFARFDGSTWARLWREPGEASATTATLPIPAEWFPPDGNVPATWHLWLLNDPRAAASPFEQRTARTLTVQGPEVLQAHCQSQVGLRVDYRGPDDRQVPANTHPKRKAGLALSVPTVRVDPATVLEPASPLATVVTDRAVAPFHRAEEDQLEILDAGWRAKTPVPAFAARRNLPVKWTKVVRLGTAQALSRTYYLEGDVRYASETIMAGHVWVQISGNRDTVDAEVVLTDADFKQMKFRTSLGVIQAGDRRFWVFESGAWEHETYEIYEVSGRGERPASLLEVVAGGC